MYVILLALGLAGAVAGAGLIVINPPVDTVRLAHTLLIVGAIAIAGGAILAGVAAANRQLRRIAQMLDTTRAQPRPAAAVAASEAPVGLAPLVQGPSGPVTDPASLASDPPPAPDLRAQTDAAFHPVVLDPVVAEAPAPSPTPPPSPPAEGSAFDAMWAKASRDAREKRHGPDPALDEPYADEAAAPPHDGETVTVFKSGVIDGMAYTLYTDGSIEAEMPGGTARFASVDELRAYLDEAV